MAYTLRTNIQTGIQVVYYTYHNLLLVLYETQQLLANGLIPRFSPVRQAKEKKVACKFLQQVTTYTFYRRPKS